MTRRIAGLGILLAMLVPTQPAAAQAGPGPIEAYAEVLDRPLFSADRRRHAPIPVVAAGSAILSGIVIYGSERYAVFAGDSSSPAVRVREGQRIAAGTVMRILHDRVVLARATGGEAELRLAPEIPSDGARSSRPPVPVLPTAGPISTAATTATPFPSEASVVVRTTRPTPTDAAGTMQR
jgi:hypothetical protein